MSIVAEHRLIQLQHFIDGERDFDDAITVEEYVVPVTVHPDSTITDEDGNGFGPRMVEPCLTCSQRPGVRRFHRASICSTLAR